MSTPMLRRARSGVAAITVALAATACDAGRATGVSPAPSLRAAVIGNAGNAVTATLLARKAPLAQDVSRSLTVGRQGGVIDIPQAGLHLVVPGGAIPGRTPVTITVTALAGNSVAYEFQPHGIVFLKPLVATQELSSTTWAGNTGNSALQAAYFPTASDLDAARGLANVTEFFPTDVVATGNRLHWDVPHFSGYVIATGYHDGNDQGQNEQ